MKLGSIFKGIGKVFTGAIGSFLSTGSPWGALIGGIGGLFGGRGGGGSGDGHVGVYIPPTTQEAYNIIRNLEGQVGNIAFSQYNIMKPYLDEAYNIFKTEPDIINRLFSEEEAIVSNRYSNLFNTIKQQLDNQWSKSALNLSALGMYNTPATQFIQSDIVNNIYGKIAESELKDLDAITDNRIRALLGYYDKAPQFLAGLGETYANINPDVDRYNRMLQLAGVLNGLSGSTVVYPKSTPLEQISKSLDNYIKNNAKSLPDFDQTMGKIFNGVSSIFSKIFH
jgi:hypothetical protein